MTRYLLKRVLFTIPLLLAIVVVSFLFFCVKNVLLQR